jgi:peptidyl-prolyl cis-trans isomerase D
MITTLRRSLNTWVARGFFLMLVVAFGTWGVGDVIRNLGHPTWAAKIGDRTVQVPELQEAYQQQLKQMTRMLGSKSDATPEMKQTALKQAVERLVTQTAIQQDVRRLGITVPDEALREAVYAMPAFHGPNGQFDRTAFEAVLRNNGLTEPRFLALMRQDLAQAQLLEAVRAGVAPPVVLQNQMFDSQNEKRAADYVEVPLASAPPPPAPAEADLQRWYDNHPHSYSTPEFRKIKVIVLAPETLAKGIEVSDDELKAAYEQRRAQFQSPEKRSAQVIMAQDQAHATALATAWRSGADWTRMQQEAKEAGASAVELDDATRQEFPSTEIADAVFKAPAQDITGPTQSPLGWSLIRVTKIVPAEDRNFDQVRDELKRRIVAEKAADLIYDRANKVDNVLATGASLDQLPNDLGLAAVQGTLDAKGNSRSGNPAPIPGPAELRSAVITAAFQTAKGEPPHLAEVQTPSEGGSAYYALSVEEIDPPAVKPFEEVKQQVTTDWTHNAIRHEQEESAAKIYAAVKGGQSLADAATVAGLTLRHSPPTGRRQAAEGVPAALLEPLFGLKNGEPTMVETPDGFIVAVLTDIEHPDPKADPSAYNQVREQLARSLGDDLELAFAGALRERVNPRINQTILNSIIQP